ncbi:MAG TPA: hypothetical protein VN937_20250 [Blastocatellia bacterium]|nr:hypothetical protein [Blastocatellia bacterium]
METKFRPIPITILDFLGILLPGFVWLILLATTIQILVRQGDAAAQTPLDVCGEIASTLKSQEIWIAAVTLIVASLIVGYILKPFAMRVSEWLSRYLFKLEKRHRGIPLQAFRFPYDEIFRHTDGYQKAGKLIQGVIKCSPDKLFGSRLFAASKRYLRLMAPALWEESERMEAEVRMAGALFLAFLYSTVLSTLSLILGSLHFRQIQNKSATWTWWILSVCLAFAIGTGLNRLRIREVGYTYMNTLIAFGCREAALEQGHESKNRDDDD